MAMKNGTDALGDGPGGGHSNKRHSLAEQSMQGTEQSVEVASIRPSGRCRRDMSLRLSTWIIIVVYFSMAAYIGLSTWTRTHSWYEACVGHVITCVFIYLLYQLYRAIARRSPVHAISTAICALGSAVTSLFVCLCVAPELIRLHETTTAVRFGLMLLPVAFVASILMFAAGMRMRRFGLELWDEESKPKEGETTQDT